MATHYGYYPRSNYDGDRTPKAKAKAKARKGSTLARYAKATASAVAKVRPTILPTSR